MSWEIREGDCREVMRAMEADSIDAIVTDPPYGLSDIRPADVVDCLRAWVSDSEYDHGKKGFMARKWDGWVPGPEYWRECLRVAKPGAFLVAFGGTRTSDLLSIAIRLAGWEVRDCLMWLYGSGFPKSHNVAAGIDKSYGYPNRGKAIPTASTYQASDDDRKNKLTSNPIGEYLPRCADSIEHDGKGTALKPAWEDIILARKPFAGTVAENVLKWGCGALNIDATRIGTEHITINRFDDGAKPFGGGAGHPYSSSQSQGRWPANLALSHHSDCVRREGLKSVRGDGRGDCHGRRGSGFADIGADKGDSEPNARVYGTQQIENWDCHPECPVRLLDTQSGELTSGEWKGQPAGTLGPDHGTTHGNRKAIPLTKTSDRGFASRFFYTSKASREEREAGLDGETETVSDGRRKPIDNPYLRGKTERRNVTPTVKPIGLMRWLVRLVTPSEGTALDLFCGSGTTLVAARIEGFNAIGIDSDSKAVEIARKRVAWAGVEAGNATEEDANEVGIPTQLGLFKR